MMNAASQSKVSRYLIQSGNQVDYPCAGLNAGQHEADQEYDNASDLSCAPPTPFLSFSDLTDLPKARPHLKKAISKPKSRKAKDEAQGGKQKFSVRIKRRPGAPHNTSQFLLQRSSELRTECTMSSSMCSMIGIVSVAELVNAEEELVRFQGKFRHECPTVDTSIPNTHYPFNRGNEVIEEGRNQGSDVVKTLLQEIKLRDRKIEHLEDLLQERLYSKNSSIIS